MRGRMVHIKGEHSVFKIMLPFPGCRIHIESFVILDSFKSSFHPIAFINGVKMNIFFIFFRNHLVVVDIVLLEDADRIFISFDLSGCGVQQNNKQPKDYAPSLQGHFEDIHALKLTELTLSSANSQLQWPQLHRSWEPWPPSRKNPQPELRIYWLCCFHPGLRRYFRIIFGRES